MIRSDAAAVGVHTKGAGKGGGIDLVHLAADQPLKPDSGAVAVMRSAGLQLSGSLDEFSTCRDLSTGLVRILSVIVLCRTTPEQPADSTINTIPGRMVRSRRRAVFPVGGTTDVVLRLRVVISEIDSPTGQQAERRLDWGVSRIARGRSLQLQCAAEHAGSAPACRQVNLPC